MRIAAELGGLHACTQFHTTRSDPHRWTATQRRQCLIRTKAQAYTMAKAKAQAKEKQTKQNSRNRRKRNMTQSSARHRISTCFYKTNNPSHMHTTLRLNTQWPTPHILRSLTFPTNRHTGASSSSAAFPNNQDVPYPTLPITHSSISCSSPSDAAGSTSSHALTWLPERQEEAEGGGKEKKTVHKARGKEDSGDRREADQLTFGR